MSTLDLRGAAALMNVHPRTVEAMARDGRLPAAKIGRAWVLLQGDVMAFIARQIASQTAARGEGMPAGAARGRTPGSRPESHQLR